MSAECAEVEGPRGGCVPIRELSYCLLFLRRQGEAVFVLRDKGDTDLPGTLTDSRHP